MNSARRSLLGMLAGGLAWGAPVWAQGKAVIGVSMPTVTSQRWVSDGLAITKALDGLGYRPELQYAKDDAATQALQIEGMLQRGAKLLIVAPVSSKELSAVLKKAAALKVKVISYDRLIRDSAHVDFYATFDNFHVGVLQGSDIVKRLGLAAGRWPWRPSPPKSGAEQPPGCGWSRCWSGFMPSSGWMRCWPPMTASAWP